MTRIPMTNGLEHDALSGWRKVLSFRAGQRAKVKKSYRRRERRVLNKMAQEGE